MVMVSSVVIAAFVVVFVTIYTQTHSDNREKLMFAMPAPHVTLSGEAIRQGMALRSEYTAVGPAFAGFTRGISPYAGMSFAIMLDSQNNVAQVNSMLDWPQETYARIAAEVIEAGDGTDTITIEGRTWQYIISPITAFFREVPVSVFPFDADMGWSTTGGAANSAARRSGIVPNEVIIGGAYNGGADTGGVYNSWAYNGGTGTGGGTPGGGTPGGINGTEYTHIRFLDVTDSLKMIRSLAFTLSGLSLVILAVFFFISLFFANRAIRPMEEAWEKQSRFIADASHEIKTPLSVINANCGVLYAGKEETVESQIKWVDSIMRASGRMSGLVNKLLALASVEDAQIAIQKNLFDLSGTVAEAVSEMEAAAIEKGLVLNKEIEPGIEIESDREHVRKVLYILLDNAVKYTGDGGELTVSLKKERRHITCAVCNSGEGIPTESLPYIFDRFYRGDPARSSENSGYGLGLSIAKAVSNQLGAKLTVVSVMGEYTEFRLVFPEN